MGITPITNLTPLPVSRLAPAALEPLPMERVENTARTGDETYSPSNRKSARGSEDGANEDDLDVEIEFEDEARAVPSPAGEPRQVSFFA